jgi:hypothetical protein
MFGAPALSAPYVVVGTTPDGRAILQDRGSIRVVGNSSQVWEYIVHAKKRSDGMVFMAVHSEYDCLQEQVIVDYMQDYDENGATVGLPAVTSPQDGHPIMPGTNAEAALKEACSSNPQHPVRQDQGVTLIDAVRRARAALIEMSGTR